MSNEQQSMFFSREQRVEHRIEQLLGGRTTPQLGDDETRLLRVLQYHKGHARAIKIHDLAKRTGLGERDIKAGVRALVVDHQLPVASSKSSTDGGYYLITTDDEQRQAASSVAKQIHAEALRHRVLTSPHETAELLGQLTIEVQQ